MIRSALTFISCIVVLSFAAFGQPLTASQLPTKEQFAPLLSGAPCDDKDRFEAVKDLFLEAGATEDAITVDKHKSVDNLIVTKKGLTDEILVLGAHYDKIGGGCGVIDNWSGIVILAEIFRTIREIKTKKTILFVAFGKEELGLVGSSKMVSAIDKKELPKYCAMVNFDSFGRAVPQALANVSSKKMIQLAESVSEEMKIPFGKAGIDFARSDSASFQKRNIPAMTLHGLGDGWENIIHSKNDTMESVDLLSVYLGFRHGLVMLSRLDAASCDAFRK